jgi:L-fuculose-phosphate aldolase
MHFDYYALRLLSGSSSRDILKVYPRGDRSKGLRGVFATRSPIRPNPIAISELKVQAIHGNLVEVSGLDILDGTPILDIKSKIQRDQSPRRQ